MVYISVKELSQKWGTSSRSIQQYCAAGKIQGAHKVGNVWIIPDSIQKSDIFKRSAEYHPYRLLADAYQFRPGQADALLAELPEDERQQIVCEYAYLRGEFGKAQIWYRTTTDKSKTRICAMNIAAVEAVALGDYDLYQEIVDKLQDMKNTFEKNNLYYSIIEISVEIIRACAHAAKNEMKISNISSLSAENQKLISLQESYYHYQHNNFERVIGILETAFHFVQEDRYSPIDLYLWLMCGLAYYNKGDAQMAVKYVKLAADMGLADGFIMPYAEFLAAYDSILGDYIKSIRPDKYDTIMKLGDRIWNRLIPIHNNYTNDNITMLLSRREYTVARLAVKGLNNGEIAVQMGYSKATVKKKLEAVYEKLNINKRSMLSEYII